MANYKAIHKMAKNLIFKICLCFVIFMSSVIYGAEPEDVTSPLIPDPINANWLFSGVVENENGENFGYFFQMQRENEHFHTTVALFDGQTKSAILLDESDAYIHDVAPYNWHVGRSFLRFNPINDSWIFGVKTKAKIGFNFKVDMLQGSTNTQVAQGLRPGVEFLVNQTGHLNGHIQIDKDSKEQFVTAKNAWFRQVWLTANEDKKQQFSGVLCRFNNGSGFYSVNTTESDALRGAVAGWQDAHGVSATMSQFINVNQAPEGPWHIRISSPNIHLVLNNFIKQNSMVAGFVSQGNEPGFCALSKNVFGNEADISTG